MNKATFDFLARKLRSKEPAISAARLVLVHGLTAADACKNTGISPASLSRSLKSFRELDAEIREIYAVREKKGLTVNV